MNEFFRSTVVCAAEQAFSHLSANCYVWRQDIHLVAQKEPRGEYLIDITVHLGGKAFGAVLHLHLLMGHSLGYCCDVFPLLYTTPDERQQCIDYLKEVYRW